MKIAPYFLKINQKQIKGALLSDGRGFAVLQPWESLGDPSLDFLIKDLVLEKNNFLVRRALELLKIDGEARSKNISLLPIQSPPSHLYLDLRDESFFLKFQEALRDGILLFKFKVGIDHLQEIQNLKKIHNEFSASKFKIRLDANLRFSSLKDFEKFLKNFESILERIDFIEDPFLGNPFEWILLKDKFNLRLAHDFADESFRELCDVWILKPTRNDPAYLFNLALKKNKKVVFTTALDHELGQLASLSIAHDFQKQHPSFVEDGGFLSFSEVQGLSSFLRRQNNVLDFEDLRGSGFGCEKLFLNLKWNDPRDFK